jgi:bacterioferritin
MPASNRPFTDRGRFTPCKKAHPAGPFFHVATPNRPFTGHGRITPYRKAHPAGPFFHASLRRGILWHPAGQGPIMPHTCGTQVHWYLARVVDDQIHQDRQEPTMKGNKKLIDALNARLSEELGAINQYIVHTEMLDNWGYVRLSKKVKARAIAEMKHAEKLIERIIFLEGTPVVSKLNPIRIGADVPKQLANDLAAENDAVAKYNATIKLAVEVGDNATKEVLDSILDDEDAHLNELEEQLDQIKQMGLEIYLGAQTKE